MKKIINDKPDIRPGDHIKLINGRNVKIPGRESYDWTCFEIVESISDTGVIRFQLCDHEATCWTIYLPWEIQRNGRNIA